MSILSEANNLTTLLSSNFSKYIIVTFSNRKIKAFGNRQYSKLKRMYIPGKIERQISDFYMESVSYAVALKQIFKFSTLKKYYQPDAT